MFVILCEYNNNKIIYFLAMLFSYLLLVIFILDVNIMTVIRMITCHHADVFVRKLYSYPTEKGYILELFGIKSTMINQFE